MRVLSKNSLPFDQVFPTVPGQCAFCSGPLTGKQKRWCSKKCSDDAWVQINVRRGVSTYIRKALKKRDHEICAACGVDLNLVRRIVRRAERSIWQWEGSGDAKSFGIWDASRKMRETLLQLIIWPLYGERSSSGQFWQGDHIVEFRAGGEHTLDNLQTLCTLCHKQKTASFAAIRANERKDANCPLLVAGTP